MKKVSAFAFAALTRVALLAPIVVTSAAVVGCADENDPKTWAKRLDDQAQRAPAIKRLESFYNDAMSAASTPNKQDDEKVKAILDASVEPLTKTYITGGLDEKTRKDLIKLLGDMGDPRASAAYAKAFKDFEPGKNDDDVKYAAQGTTRLVAKGPIADQGLIDSLWDCFAKFQPSKNMKSINLVKDLQGAVMAVKDKSYGAKAVEKLAAPVTDPKDPAQGMDQIQFWQVTAVQLIGELKFTPGVKPLVKVLMTPTKSDLIFPVRLALTRMPKEAEPVLIAALKGTDPDLQALAEKYPEKAYIPRVAEPLAYISRPAGRDAIIEALEKADNDSEPHGPRDGAHALPERREEREGVHRRLQQGRAERGHRAPRRRQRPRDHRAGGGELLRPVRSPTGSSRRRPPPRARPPTRCRRPRSAPRSS